MVHLAVNRRTGRQRACKVMKKALIAKKDLYDKVELEVRILTELKHVSLLSSSTGLSRAMLTFLAGKHP